MLEWRGSLLIEVRVLKDRGVGLRGRAANSIYKGSKTDQTARSNNENADVGRISGPAA